MEKFDIGALLDLQTQIGMLATVAVIVDIATGLRKQIDFNSSSEMADSLLDKLRFEVYADDAPTELWAHLLSTLTTGDLRTAGTLQTLVREAMAANRSRGVQAESTLATTVNELLVRPRNDQETSRAKKKWEDIVKEDLGDVAKLKREVELIAKKGTLLAVLHCRMEDQTDAVIDTITDKNESIEEGSEPVEQA